MSEFDKEAEREKLREKYEEDQEKRQHTQRMSDLLLKGATMTNQHCNQCGDPIFRHEGQEFCPSCGTGEAAEEGAPEGTASETDAVAADVEPAEEASTAGQQPNAPRSQQPADVTRTADPQQGTPATQQSTPAEQSTATQQSTPTQQSTATQQSTTTAEPAAEAPADLQAARESLARTVTKFARAAEATDDPRRAREHLEAAREAAEAVAALE
ncbi:MAG: Sjogren's syndrome/scleroderma autoantigen 1 family protein [Halopenitus sp.]